MLQRTTLLRLTLPALVFLAWTPVAQAWSWPLQGGAVAQPFAYDEAHPYASGQHRGIDVSAHAAGETVVAPASGTVSFAGTVPTNGESVTIETPDGYSVTLTHLGSILVVKGAAVAESEAVGTVGPSGAPEVDGPYVHLGIRVTSDPNGYVDPLGLLPPVSAESPPAESIPPAPQPAASGSSAPASPASTPVPTTRGSTVTARPTRIPHPAGARAQTSRPAIERPRLSQRPATHAPVAGTAPVRHVTSPIRHTTKPRRSSRRPVVETAAPRESTALDAGNRPALPRESPSAVPALMCNWAVALVAVAAALAARRSFRRHLGRTPIATAEVLQLPRTPCKRREQRAA